MQFDWKRVGRRLMAGAVIGLLLERGFSYWRQETDGTMPAAAAQAVQGLAQLEADVHELTALQEQRLRVVERTSDLLFNFTVKETGDLRQRVERIEAILETNQADGERDETVPGR